MAYANKWQGAGIKYQVSNRAIHRNNSKLINLRAMSVYDDEIFNYLTKKENFYSAYEITQLFPQVRNKLVEEFWKKVTERIANELDKNSKDKWVVELSEDVFETYSSLFLYFSDSIGVAFEKLHGQPYYGVWIDSDNKKLDREKINKYASGLELLEGMNKNSDYWLGWSLCGANFNTIETLKRILPENSDEYAEELAKLLFDLAVSMKSHIIKMEKMIK